MALKPGIDKVEWVWAQNNKLRDLILSKEQVAELVDTCAGYLQWDSLSDTYEFEPAQMIGGGMHHACLRDTF